MSWANGWLICYDLVLLPALLSPFRPVELGFVVVSPLNDPRATRQAVILNLPWMVKKFLDLIFKFVDPVTKAKVGFPGACCGSGDDGERMADLLLRLVGLVGELVCQGRVGAQNDRVEGSRRRCARESSIAEIWTIPARNISY
jgi:hypothetical protein